MAVREQAPSSAWREGEVGRGKEQGGWKSEGFLAVFFQAFLMIYSEVQTLVQTEECYK